MIRCGRAVQRSALLLVAVISTPSMADRAYVAEHVRDFVYQGSPAMRLPSDVALAHNGDVVVTDGVNNRILRFDKSGRWIETTTEVGGLELSQPMSAGFDDRGRLWIADSGNARVVAIDRQKNMVVQINLTDVEGARHGDPTDCLYIPDPPSVWIVDNDNHRLLQFDEAGNRLRTVASEGMSLGQLYYPFALAFADAGDLLVSDVVNGRVHRFTTDGMPAGVIGEYGVQAGQLFRPKGLFVGGEGDVWVTDSVIGVIQVFNVLGGHRGIVSNADGSPLKLDGPSGIVLDEQRNLFVVEMNRDRVRQFKVTIDETGDQKPTTARTPRNYDQPRVCTACHMEWLQPLVDGIPTAIAAVPDNPPEHPAASRDRMCLSCHDGALVDSRRDVWVEHGHRTGIVPSMNVPEDLPLIDGRIACRTCHSAHTRGGSGHAFRDPVFLRVETDARELCVKCHKDQSGGLAQGFHPVELTDVHAQNVPTMLGEGELSCLTCHQPHGSAEDALLKLADGGAQMCISCHTDIGPSTAGHMHPLGIALENPAHVQAIQDMGALLSRDRTLTCLSCHAMHHGLGSEALLVETQRESRLCLHCHSQQAAIARSQHDLRYSAPQERNLHGDIAEISGPCGACHGVHKPARSFAATEADRSGQCATCHQPGRCASNRVNFTTGHPTAFDDADVAALAEFTRSIGGESAQSSCGLCHNPHETSHAMFLRAEPDQLCATCHGDIQLAQGSPHDFRRRGDMVNAKGRSHAESGNCGFCHAVHGTTAPALWNATNNVPQSADALCTNCHADDGFAPAAPQLSHPRAVASSNGDHGFPHYAADGSRSPDGQMSCGTCHNPHSGADANASLLRLASDEPMTLCLNCHGDKSPIEWTVHNPHTLGAEQSCGPCHAVHGDAIAGMWAAPIGHPSNATEDPYCTGCHAAGGSAPDVRTPVHPVIPAMFSESSIGGDTAPLRQAQGRFERYQRITCTTCHLPHGHDAEAILDLPLDTEPEVRRAAGLLIRPGAAQLCVTCHGADGLSRFLYFHNE